MTNFSILYASAAVLALSAVTTLGVIATWMLGELRLRDAPHRGAVGLTGAGDEALALEVRQSSP